MGGITRLAKRTNDTESTQHAGRAGLNKENIKLTINGFTKLSNTLLKVKNITSQKG